MTTTALRRKRADITIIITVIAMTLFGIVMIYSASVILGHEIFRDGQLFFKKQILSALIGVTAMVVMANIDYRIWQKYAAWMLGITLVLLLSVFFLSRGEINGAHRWVDIGPLSFQPSELGKLTFLMYVSAWLARRQEQMHDIVGTFLPFAAVLTIISFLLLKQPDFGTLAVFFAAAVSIYLVAGMTWQQFVLGSSGVCLALLAILSEPYRRARITTFLNPTSDTSGISWHVNNIAIAIGSGGWFGLGFGASGQKRLFLPEPHTDSIFAVITEELGFMVGALVVVAFIFLAYRGFRIALRSQDVFGRLLAVGITSWFAFQAFLNLGSMAHLVPLVGVPLPFISYGGTNLIISLAAIGVLLNISRQGSDEPVKNEAPERRNSAVDRRAEARRTADRRRAA
ncbi:MAG TPA: putative lipid II flippase FtsW [Verrucomicrobiae bacterium]|nr:putative lipid II flippase FtsW [Verrucomicrobiae bacterium]